MQTKVPEYKELVAQRAALEQQIEKVQAAEREGVIAEILETMACYEIEPGDLRKTDRSKAPLKLGPAKPKYRDPATGTTWSGRGRTPRWMDGRDRSLFLIE